MALSKGSATLAAVACAGLLAAMLVGGAAVQKKLDAAFSVDVTAEAQKRLFVGCPKQVDSKDVSVTVRMIPPSGVAVAKELSYGDFDYDTDGQEDSLTHWKDLTKWAAAITGGGRLDEWISGGGTLDFQSFCGSATSVRKTEALGGGCYFVKSPASDGSLTVEYQPIVLQIAGEDIN